MSAMVGTRLSITYDKNSPQTVLADDQRLYQVRKHPLHCLHGVAALPLFNIFTSVYPGPALPPSQVVHCVMANAFKYTRKGGVTMSTEASVDGQYLTFRVVDTGTGFSKEQVRNQGRPLASG